VELLESFVYPVIEIIPEAKENKLIEKVET